MSKNELWTIKLWVPLGWNIHAFMGTVKGYFPGIMKIQATREDES